MLIHELGKLERTLVIEEAAVRSRYLWPEGADASLAHGVWSQLLKDLATTDQHRKAVEDWLGAADHWWTTGYGVGQEYLDERLREWAFLGEGREMEIPKIVPKARKATSQVCRTCNKDKPIEEYYSGTRTAGARFGSCRPCREDGIGDSSKLAVRKAATGYEAEVEGTKTCKTCRKVKPKTAFHRHPNAPDGRLLHCAVCTCARKAAARNKKARYGK